jgi:hypothetical protein
MKLDCTKLVQRGDCFFELVFWETKPKLCLKIILPEGNYTGCLAILQDESDVPARI